MKQSLQLRLGQQLTMTPQLQQAIKLLQLSTLELRTEIQQALESNLMLEPAEDAEDDYDDDYDHELAGDRDNGDQGGEAETTSQDSHNTASDNDNDNDAPASDTTETAEAARDDIPDDLPLDSDWGEVFDGSTAYSAPDSDDDQRETWENRTGEGGGSLQDHLLWQAQLAPFSDRDRAIAEAIIDGVREDGYLAVSLEDICDAVRLDEPVELDEVEAVRHYIQHFDPVGVAALSPREALLVQLDQ
ncbi:MAG: RNA polymerase factor sigma-54, partial [Ectothiorhodospiraceae bacterium]